MRLFTKNRNSKKRIIEEWVYEQVADELDAGEMRKGLWTKARGLSEGDSNKCESIYIQLRAESIVDEIKLLSEANELQIKGQKRNPKAKNNTNNKPYVQEETKVVSTLPNKEARRTNELEKRDNLSAHAHVDEIEVGFSKEFKPCETCGNNTGQTLNGHFVCNRCKSDVEKNISKNKPAVQKITKESPYRALPNQQAKPTAELELSYWSAHAHMYEGKVGFSKQFEPCEVCGHNTGQTLNGHFVCNRCKSDFELKYRKRL